MTELEELKMLREFCRVMVNLTGKLTPGNPMVYLHARFENGTVVSCDEGNVTIAHADLGQVTVEQLDAHIEALERDADA
jgi:hypothetical protein